MKGRQLLAWNLREIRAARGLSQERLAAEAGVDRSFVGMVEREKSNVTVDTIDKFAAVLGVEVGALFRRPAEGASPPKPLSGGRRPKGG